MKIDLKHMQPILRHKVDNFVLDGIKPSKHLHLKFSVKKPPPKTKAKMLYWKCCKLFKE